MGVEGETNLHDLQALERDINAKRRDARLERVVLLIRDSKRNRDVLRAADALRRSFPLDTRAVMAALARGRDPGADGIVLLGSLTRPTGQRRAEPGLCGQVTSPAGQIATEPFLTGGSALC